MSRAEGCGVVVCADASASIGVGHLVRSLALAEAFSDAGWTVTLRSHGVPPELHDRIPGALTVPIDRLDPTDVITASPELAVVDGYDYPERFFADLESSGVPHVIIDDNGETSARRPIAVINQNPSARPEHYRHLAGNPRLLLGTEFALLRREVVAAAERRLPQRANTVLVAFGGSDPAGLTEPVVRALAAAALDVRVAVGPAHPERDRLVAELATIDRVEPTTPGRYIEELATAGVAVIAAGSTMYETACLGIPTVAVVVADNQRAPARAAASAGLIDRVIDANRIDDDLLASVVEARDRRPGRRRSSIDGDGATRCVHALIGLIRTDVRLRKATADDAEFLFVLRTDPTVDDASFGSAPTWPQHLAWLDATLLDDSRRLLVIEAAGSPVGQLRLDSGDGESKLSMALAADARGRGLGREALRQMVGESSTDLVAEAQPDNRASIAAFESAGFVIAHRTGHAVTLRWSPDACEGSRS